jgi:hypothetical protein
MARFQLTMAISVSQMRFHAGEIVTDTLPTVPTNDRYWPGLTAATMAPGMVPLDAGAIAIKAASAFAGEVIRTWISGVDSIDA